MRTRFAPSPTGFLHIGGLRTALYAYLVAKQTNGEFVLRIEDTDQERVVPGATENILTTLRWAGLMPDGKPYIQSEHLDIYQRYAKELQKSGFAYPCFCTPKRLEIMRKDQYARKEAPMYDRLCLSYSASEVQKKIAAGEPHALRLKVPREETISFDDDIRGTVTFKGWVSDDPVLLKSDGFPTYHLAHVVDDHLMDVNIVIRGEEWLSSLPKHLILFRCLEWQPPRYAHVPLLLNKDKTKLSKRQNDVAVEDYITKGYLPEALINFIALLGWNPGTSRAEPSGTGQRPGTEKEIFSLKELIDQFSLDRVQKHGAVFDTDKLNWLQGQWIRKIPPTQFARRIQPIVAAKYSKAGSDDQFERKAALIRERITFFHEAPDMLAFFYADPTIDIELLANKKQKISRTLLPEIVNVLIENLETITEDKWTESTLQKKLFSIPDEKKLKRGQLLWPLRAILTGLPFSPGAFEVATVLGKDETLKRLQKAKEIL